MQHSDVGSGSSDSDNARRIQPSLYRHRDFNQKGFGEITEQIRNLLKVRLERR